MHCKKIFKNATQDPKRCALECEWRNSKEGNDCLLVPGLPTGMELLHEQVPSGANTLKCWHAN